MFNQSGYPELKLTSVLDYIINLGKSLEGQSISYYSEKDQMDVLVGVYPVETSYKIPRDDFSSKLQLKMKENSSKDNSTKR